MTLETIARAYGCTRQAVHRLEKDHDIARADWLEPELIFRKLLADGVAGRTRKNLIDPRRRDAIREALATTDR